MFYVGACFTSKLCMKDAVTWKPSIFFIEADGRQSMPHILAA